MWLGQARPEGETEPSLPWAWQCGRPLDMPGLEGKGLGTLVTHLVWGNF